jgi:hypothetical protein
MESQIVLSRRRVSANAAVVAAMTTPGAAASLDKQKDAVFVLIDAHLQAMRDSAAATEAAEALAGCDGEGEDSPECIAANTRRYEAWEAEDSALFAFLTTAPITIAGALAALDHASSPQYPDEKLVEKFAAPVLFAATCTQDADMVGAGARFPAMIAAALRKLLVEVQS